MLCENYGYFVFEGQDFRWRSLDFSFGLVIQVIFDVSEGFVLIVWLKVVLMCKVFDKKKNDFLILLKYIINFFL